MTGKRDVSHRQLFERIGRLEGKQNDRYLYDRKRDREEDRYRARVLKMFDAMLDNQKKLDGLPKRVAALETAKRKVDGWALRGKLTAQIARYILIGAVSVVILIGAGFAHGIEIIFSWFAGR